MLTVSVYDHMVAACLDAWPLEACGLFAGSETEVATALACYPAHNAAQSSRVYTVEPKDLLQADRQAEAAGMGLLGVWHSHTHTDAYPSPTDIAKGDNPMLAGWRFAIVSLRHESPSLRCYLLDGGVVVEEPVELF